MPANQHPENDVLKNTNILVCEDDTNSALVLRRTLERAGYIHIVLARSGREALSHLEKHRVDICITDIGMPGEFDGIETARRVDSHYGIPIIFITGFSDRETICRAKNIQPAAYVLKPFKADEVTIAVEMALHKAAMQRELLKTERQNRMLAAALAGTQDAVIIADADSPIPIVHYANAAFTQLMGYQNAEILGKPISILYGEKTGPGYQEQREKLLKKTHYCTWENTLYAQSGKPILVQVSASIIGEPVPENVVFILRDITEMRHAEERQRHSQRLEAIGRFTGGIAHDFNNILAIINAYSDLLRLKVEEKSPCIKYIQNIRIAGQRGTDLVAQLMTFARSRPTPPELLDVRETFEPIFRMLRRIVRENISLEATYAPHLPKVRASASQLEQILVNLCVNARDAIPEAGTITLHTEACRCRQPESTAETEPTLYLCINVKDSGCGMDAETVEKIFEPFFTTKDIGKGTGLGLSTVYGIVKQYHGFIEVDSAPGKGTTFRIYLPAEHAETSPTHSKALPVLIIENDPELEKTLSVALSQQGYQPLYAVDIEEALDLHADDADTIALVISRPHEQTPLLLDRFLTVNPKLPFLFIGQPANLRAHRGLTLLEDFDENTLLESCKKLLSS